MAYKCIFLLLSVVAFSMSCETANITWEKKYNFTFNVNKTKDKTIVSVKDCSKKDYLKYALFAEILLKDLPVNKKTSFYFNSIDGYSDTLKFSKEEIKKAKENYRKYPCVFKEDKKILLKLENDKILFYDSILYEIIKYDSYINNVDTATYLKRDVSIISILHNKCRYANKTVPKDFEIQSKYLEVLKIWCEDKKKYPLFDLNDLN